MDKELLIHAQEIVAEVTVATAGAPNEASLRHELEKMPLTFGVFPLTRRLRYSIYIVWTRISLLRSAESTVYPKRN